MVQFFVVVIPAYNAEQFIKRVAYSVLEQANYDQIGLILVGDG